MAEVLAQLSDDLAETVSRASPSIVRVDARRRIGASGVVWSADGLIVTSHHVVERDENINIGLPDGREVPASLVGRDPTTDVAVLRAQASDLVVPRQADIDSLRVGHIVLAVGRPGRNPRATLGIVSALGEAWNTPAGSRVDRYLQTDVTMYPGFSGGPLVDVTGGVLGINTSVLLRGISLTIPVATIARVVESILAHGKVRRGYLGIGGQVVRLPESLARQTGQETGVLVASVETGSPAERAGLMLGDTIVTLDGQPVRGLDDLLALLSGERVGKKVGVRTVRSGQLRDLAVAIGERS